VLPSFNLQVKTDGNPYGAVLFLSDPLAMLLSWRLKYANTLTDSQLQATLWQGHPPWPGIMTFEKPVELAALRFEPDLLDDGTAGWTSTRGDRRTVNSSAVLDEIVKFFLEKAQSR